MPCIATCQPISQDRLAHGISCLRTHAPWPPCPSSQSVPSACLQICKHHWRSTSCPQHGQTWHQVASSATTPRGCMTVPQFHWGADSTGAGAGSVCAPAANVVLDSLKDASVAAASCIGVPYIMHLVARTWAGRLITCRVLVAEVAEASTQGFKMHCSWLATSMAQQVQTSCCMRARANVPASGE